MELLSMDNLRESNKNFVRQYLREFGDIEKANKLIKLFSRPDLPKDYGTFILDGWLDELNKILREWGG